MSARGKRLLQWTAVVTALLLFTVVIIRIQRARSTINKPIDARTRLRLVYIALRQYEDRSGYLPTAYSTSPDGLPMHSWRLMILAGGDDRDIFERADFGEPWSSNKNALLYADMPAAFGYASQARDPLERYTTSIVVVRGKDTLWPDGRSMSIRKTMKVAPLKIVAIEIATRRVPWLGPIDVAGPGSQARDGDVLLEDVFPSKERIHCVTADGSLGYIKEGARWEDVKGLFLIKEPIGDAGRWFERD